MVVSVLGLVLLSINNKDFEFGFYVLIEVDFRVFI